MEALNFKVADFEGPLDLLLFMIRKEKIDIYDIPIFTLFSQYMEYLEQMKAMDMDIAGEFITMAAELMLIKSRMLLPRLPEDDPRAQLVDALTEYARAKDAATYLQKQYAMYCGRMVKDTDEISVDPKDLDPQDLELLERAFKRLLDRYQDRKAAEHTPEKTFDRLLNRRVVPVPERIYAIMRYLYQYGKTDFEHVLLLSRDRSELLASFMAILELAKAQRLELQEDEDGMIYLSLNRVHRRTGQNSAQIAEGAPT